MLRFVIAAALLFIALPAQAHRHPHRDSIRLDPGCNVIFPCEVPEHAIRREARRRVISAPALPSYSRAWKNEPAPRISMATAVVEHPPGCPRRLFCGCGAAVRLFGRADRSLWLAAEWRRRFPQAEPAPGRAAVWGHHIVVLESHIQGSVWMVYDANSGRHRTQIHPRSIAGAVIVDPSRRG